MAVTLQLPNGQRVSLDKTTILIGQDTACDVQFKGLQPRHASIRKMANHWLIESHGQWLVQSGKEQPGKTC